MFRDFSLGPSESKTPQTQGILPLPALDATSLLSVKESIVHLLSGLPVGTTKMITGDPKEYRKNGRDFIIPIHCLSQDTGKFFVPALYTPLERAVRDEAWTSCGKGLKKDDLKMYFAAPMEMDGGTLEDQWARIMTLPENLRPTLVAFSGNKSLHCFWAFKTPATPEENLDITLTLQKLLEGDKAMTRTGQRARLPGYNSTTRKQPVIYFEKRYFAPLDLANQLSSLLAERSPDDFMEVKADSQRIRKSGGKMPTRTFDPKGEIYEAFLSAHKSGGKTSLKITPEGDMVRGNAENRKTAMKDGCLFVTDFSPDGNEVYIFSGRSQKKRDAIIEHEDLYVAGLKAPSPPKEEREYVETAVSRFNAFLAEEKIRLNPPQVDDLIPSDWVQTTLSAMAQDERKGYVSGCRKGLKAVFAKDRNTIGKTNLSCWSHSCPDCHAALSAATLFALREVIYKMSRGLTENLFMATSPAQDLQGTLSQFCRENPGSFYLWVNTDGTYNYLLYTSRKQGLKAPEVLSPMDPVRFLDAVSAMPRLLSKQEKGERFRMIGGTKEIVSRVIALRNDLIGKQKASPRLDGEPQKYFVVPHFPKVSAVETLLQTKLEDHTMLEGGLHLIFLPPEFESSSVLKGLLETGGMTQVKRKVSKADLEAMAEELNMQAVDNLQSQEA